MLYSGEQKNLNLYRKVKIMAATNDATILA